MTLNTSLQFREVNRFDRVLFSLVRSARRLVEWADGHVHAAEVVLRRDFSQRREQNEARPRTPTPRSFAVIPELERDAAEQTCTRVVAGGSRRRKCEADGCQNRAQRGSTWCEDCRRGVVRPRTRRSHTTAADFDRRFAS